MTNTNSNFIVVTSLIVNALATTTFLTIITILCISRWKKFKKSSKQKSDVIIAENRSRVTEDIVISGQPNMIALPEIALNPRYIDLNLQTNYESEYYEVQYLSQTSSRDSCSLEGAEATNDDDFKVLPSSMQCEVHANEASCNESVLHVEQEQCVESEYASISKMKFLSLSCDIIEAIVNEHMPPIIPAKSEELLDALENETV